MRRIALAALAFGAALGTSSLALETDAGAPGTWAERVQAVYDARHRTVTRQSLRVRDLHPRRDLEFTWEPDPAEGLQTIGADGVVSGRGTLVWRVRGSASYDPRAVFSTYVGDMRDGLAHGSGRLVLRDGETFEGEWRHGVLHGRGMHLEAGGNRYEGTFADGNRHGEGRLMLVTGVIHEGTFRDGMLDGPARTRLADGSAYASTWEMGTETGERPPAALADGTLGGLLRAQDGGDAARVELSIAVDQRMTQQAEMRYIHWVREDDIAIVPDSELMIDFWNGEAEVDAYNYSLAFGAIDWEDPPAFVQLDMTTTDRSRVRVDRLELEVADSSVYRKPFLSVTEHFGCVGFQPYFTMQNNGWGPLRDGSMSMRFVNGERPDVSTREFSLDIGSFEDGTDVTVTSVLREAGVDTDALASRRFTCPSLEALPVCRAQLMNEVDFGELADTIDGEMTLYTTATGQLEYEFADDHGNLHAVSEPYRVRIFLTAIEVEFEAAECGAPFGGSPEALRFQTIEFENGRSNYVVDLPIRGNRNLASHTARLKLYADKTSTHQFRAAAHLADGSTRYSKPVTFYFVRPREHWYESRIDPGACYLGATIDTAGSC